MIGVTALPADSPFFGLLLYGGLSAVALGMLGLLLLLITATKAEPKPETSRAEAIVLPIENNRLAATRTFLPSGFIADAQRNTTDQSLRIQVRVYDKSSTSSLFGNSLIDSLNAAGWEAFDFGFDGGTRNFAGIVIAVRNPNTLTPPILKIVAALRSCGFSPAIESVNSWPDDFIRIGVGSLG